MKKLVGMLLLCISALTGAFAARTQSSSGTWLMPASSSQSQKALSADDYTAIKAAQKANAIVRSLDWTRAERLSLPDGTTSVPDFLGRAIVIPVSVKSVVCA